MKMFIKLLSLFYLLHYTHSSVLELTCEDIRAFVDGHNNRRYKLAHGEVEYQPPASNMKAVVWDQELARKAADWAATYNFDHNPDRTLASGRFDIGENIFMSSSPDVNYKLKIDEVLDSWFSENANFTFAPLSEDNFGPGHPKIGHYTQMVWTDSVYVGCGISSIIANNYKTYYVVCDYGPSGNFEGQTPYEPGTEGETYPLVCNAFPGCKHRYGNWCDFN